MLIERNFKKLRNKRCTVTPDAESRRQRIRSPNILLRRRRIRLRRTLAHQGGRIPPKNRDPDPHSAINNGPRERVRDRFQTLERYAKNERTKKKTGQHNEKGHLRKVNSHKKNRFGRPPE